MLAKSIEKFERIEEDETESLQESWSSSKYTRRMSDVSFETCSRVREKEKEREKLMQVKIDNIRENERDVSAAFNE